MEGEQEQNQVIEQQNQEQNTEVESRARIQGWVPKEEFRGDPARWIPAQDFVKRADEMMPILRSVNKKLEGQVSDLNRKLTDTQGMIEKMVKIQGKYSEDFYTSRISEIKAQKRKAAQDQDFDLYDRLEREEMTFAKPEPIEVKPAQPNDGLNGSDAGETERWIEENRSWYGTDQEMTEFAEMIGDQMKNRRHRLATPGNAYAFCQEVKKRLQAAFPHKFSNPNRNRSSEMDESNLRGGETQTGGSGKGWNDLPGDARAQANKLIREIPGYTKEKYLKDYFEGA